MPFLLMFPRNSLVGRRELWSSLCWGLLFRVGNQQQFVHTLLLLFSLLVWDVFGSNDRCWFLLLFLCRRCSFRILGIIVRILCIPLHSKYSCISDLEWGVGIRVPVLFPHRLLNWHTCILGIIILDCFRIAVAEFCRYVEWCLCIHVLCFDSFMSCGW